MGDPVHDCQLHGRASEQPQRPSCATFGRLPARHCDRPCFPGAIELSRCRRVLPSPPLQRRIQPFLDETLPNVSYRIRADAERFTGPLIRPVRTISIDVQKDSRVAHLPRIRGTLRNQRLQPLSLLRCQTNDVLLPHVPPSRRLWSRQSLSMTPGDFRRDVTLELDRDASILSRRQRCFKRPILIAFAPT